MVVATGPVPASAGVAAGPGVSSVLVGAGPEGVAVDAVTNTIYVANSGGDSVSVVNGVTDKVTKTIKLPKGAAPSGVAVDPVTDKIYVVEPGIADVQVINGATNALGASISFLTLSGAPDSIAVDPATDTIFVASLGGLFKIDGSTNQFTADGGEFGTQDGAVAINQATGFPYTADPIDGAFDLRPGASHLSVNINPISVAAGNRVFFVSNCLAGWFSTVWEFDAGTDKQLQQNGAPWLCPRTLAVRGSTVFAANASALAILNVTLDAVTGTFSQVRDSAGLTINSKTGTVYATDGAGRLWVMPRQAPAFNSPASLTVPVGVAGTAFWVQTSANPAPSYSETGKLPAGVSMTSAGEIFVDPAAGTEGQYPITISASNGVGAASAQPFVLTVTQVPAITSAAKTTCKPGHQCQFTIETTGFPFAKITMAGHLPNGLKLVAGAGGRATIEGKAAKSAAGRTFHPTFTATNSVGQAQQKFTLRVS